MSLVAVHIKTLRDEAETPYPTPEYTMTWLLARTGRGASPGCRLGAQGPLGADGKTTTR